MDQYRNRKKNELPLEIWFQILHYISISDILQLSLVCKDFNRLLQTNSLWRYHCLARHSAVTLSQVNAFPSCKDFYRNILKPFSWALGKTIMFPGTGRMGRVLLQDQSLVITPLSKTMHQVLMRVEFSNNELRMERLVDNFMVQFTSVQEAQRFIEQNVVVYFFDRYMRVDRKLIRC